MIHPTNNVGMLVYLIQNDYLELYSFRLFIQSTMQIVRKSKDSNIIHCISLSNSLVFVLLACSRKSKLSPMSTRLITKKNSHTSQ